MKRKHLVAVALLICSTAFLLSFQALNTYAVTVHSYVYTDNSGSGGPMFSGPATSNMVPGDIVNGELEIINPLEEPVKVVGLSAKLTSSPDDAGTFPQSLKLIITKGVFSPEVVYEGTLADFIGPGAHISSQFIVPPKIGMVNGTETLNYQVIFIPEAGNETQGKSCTVDFIVNFKNDDTGGGDSDKEKHINTEIYNQDNEDPGLVTQSIGAPAPSTAPVQPDIINIESVLPAVEPVIETLQQLPETGWSGMMGGGVAALLMAAAGLTLRQMSRRRWK